MGTHNRLLMLNEGVYLEIIANHPGVPKPSRTRWFDMDQPTTVMRISTEPALTHVVAAVHEIGAAMYACPYDMGNSVAMSRGDLNWQIAIRDDGRLHEAGMIPTLIQWGGIHPTSRMSSCGMTLNQLQFEHPQIDRIRSAHEAIGFANTNIPLRYTASSHPCFKAILTTPSKGEVALQTHYA